MALHISQLDISTCILKHNTIFHLKCCNLVLSSPALLLSLHEPRATDNRRFNAGRYIKPAGLRRAVWELSHVY